MSNGIRDDRTKAVICDCLCRNYEYLGDGRIRHKGSEKARKAVLGRRYCNMVLGIKGRKYTLFYHQAVWIVCHGRWPKGEIDHIDGDRQNNRIENLRDVNSWQNMWNKLLPWRPNSVTNVAGVNKDSGKGVYKAWLYGSRIYSADKYKLFHDAALCGKTYRADCAVGEP